MEKLDVWTWIIILMSLVVILIMTNPFKLFTKEYWENELFWHRCKRDNPPHIYSVTKEDVEQWEREERRLIRKIKKFERKK